MKEKKEKAGKRNRLADWFRRSRETQTVELTQEERLQREITTAREEWALAQRHMDYVSDPDLVDHAIYCLEAAERKYGYLLREAKRQWQMEREKALKTQA